MIIKDLFTLVILKLKKSFKKRIKLKVIDPQKQYLDIYWNKEFAEILETWGEEHVWNEIQLLLINVKGKILDIACGTGNVIHKLNKYKNLELYGFDISDLLIERARKKDILYERLIVCDATNTNFPDEAFDFSYSIGSLEHFTNKGIDDFISECSRYTKSGSFHMIPVSRSGTDEGWLTTVQSFFNNSEGWWLEKFSKYFPIVHIVKSSWSDNISNGIWILCYK